ncbi:MAG: HD domain-containing protein [Acidobacteriota bacterium]
MTETALPTRQESWELLCKYTEKPGLRGHALCVEAAMRWYAGHYGEDEELWGQTGLLHDFDYERYPSAEDHPFRGVEILRERGYPETLCDAILGHAPHTGHPRTTRLAHALFACDEISGFLVACALVKPSKKIGEVQWKSVRKKLKDKAFARGVSREDVRLGAEELGVALEEHVGNVLEALRGISDELGL